jgi:hypothetical protein
MTTWDNSDITSRKARNLSRSHAVIYTIAGANGDIGGTLTASGFKSIDNVKVNVWVTTGPAGYNTNLTWYILGKTVVVAYDDPTDTHTVKIQVWGLKG